MEYFTSFLNKSKEITVEEKRSQEITDIIKKIKDGSIGSNLDLSGDGFNGIPKIKTQKELISIFETLYSNNTITSINLAGN